MEEKLLTQKPMKNRNLRIREQKLSSKKEKKKEDGNESSNEINSITEKRK